MKAPIVSRYKISLAINIVVSGLMFWVAVDSLLRREWLSGVLFTLVLVSTIFTLITERRETIRDESRIT